MEVADVTEEKPVWAVIQTDDIKRNLQVNPHLLARKRQKTPHPRDEDGASLADYPAGSAGVSGCLMMVSSASGASFQRYAQRPSASFTEPGCPVSGSGSKAISRLSHWLERPRLCRAVYISDSISTALASWRVAATSSAWQTRRSVQHRCRIFGVQCAPRR